MILILAKHCQKTVETSQPPLNVLPVFIITEKSFLVQSVYVKQRTLISLYIAHTFNTENLIQVFVFISISVKHFS